MIQPKIVMNAFKKLMGERFVALIMQHNVLLRVQEVKVYI